MIAAQSVAASAPDGYTTPFYTMNMACTSPVMPVNKININPDKDLMPIVIIAGLDKLLYVSAKTDFKAAGRRPLPRSPWAMSTNDVREPGGRSCRTFHRVRLGLGAPARTSLQVVDRLNAEVNKLKDPAFAEKRVSLGFQPTGGSVDEMKATILRDRTKWEVVIDDNNIGAEQQRAGSLPLLRSGP